MKEVKQPEDQKGSTSESELPPWNGFWNEDTLLFNKHFSAHHSASCQELGIIS